VVFGHGDHVKAEFLGELDLVERDLGRKLPDRRVIGRMWYRPSWCLGKERRIRVGTRANQ